ncbi:PhzF family phenazine biosynthesis protein [Aerococcus viridans]|uniref:PhzF family phenazine biosynthesis protein n=1 Tax=Aerococcus viridans TaxID=1377 RepID=UPI0038080BE1
MEEIFLSETAFAAKEAGNYHLRWFTPGGEINLCGPVTDFVILNYIDSSLNQVSFDTLSGQN